MISQTSFFGCLIHHYGKFEISLVIPKYRTLPHSLTVHLRVNNCSDIRMYLSNMCTTL